MIINHLPPFQKDPTSSISASNCRIESWGRGIQRIFEACRAGGAPEPVLKLSGHDLWTEFPYSPEYLDVIAEGSVKPSVESSVKKGGEKGGETPVEKLDEKLNEKLDEKLGKN